MADKLLPLTYSLADLPRVLGISLGSVRKLIKDGSLPSRKLARRTIVLRSDVDLFLYFLPMLNETAVSQKAEQPGPAALLGKLCDQVDRIAAKLDLGTEPSDAPDDLQFADVPADFRAAIRSDLEAELGRAPSEQQILTRYKEFMTDR